MKTFGVIVLILFLIFVTFTGSIFLAGVSALNREASLRAAIEAHEKVREATLDNMRKIIAQKSQLPAAAKADLLQLLPEVVSGRSGGNAFKAVSERYPEMTLDLYKDLSRSIEAERHVFLNEQEKILDLSREHSFLLNSIFSGTVCKMFGRQSINVEVISSTESKEIVKSGVEDDVDLKLSPK